MDQWVEQLSRGIALGGASDDIDSPAAFMSDPCASFDPFGGIAPAAKTTNGGKPMIFGDVTNSSSHSAMATSAKDPKVLPASCDPAVISALPFRTFSDSTQPPIKRCGDSSSPVMQDRPEMLVRGDVLTAAKLLQLAKPPSKSTSSVVPFTQVSADCASLSPSRSSTPHSVANAVLDGEDDEDDDSAGIGYMVRQMVNSNRLDQLFSGSSRSETPTDGSSTVLSPTAPTSGPMMDAVHRQSQAESWCAIANRSSQAGYSNPSRTSPHQPLAGASSGPASFSVVSGGYATSDGPSVRRMIGQPIQQQTSAGTMPQAAHISTTTTTSNSSSSFIQPAPIQRGDVTVVLEFKMKRLVRFRCPPEVGTIALNQFCIVQFDHSGIEDAGMCVALYTWQDRHNIPRSLGLSDSGAILRLATEADCEVINEQLPALEEVALAGAHQLIHFLHLPFVCVDAEYTFDKKQVKMFYSLAPQASTSIVPNFSRFQRELAFKLGAKVCIEQVKNGM